MTLIEMMWWLVLSLLVVSAVMVFVVVSVGQENSASSRAVASRQAETGLEQLIRDLRHAMAADASGNPLHLTVSSDGTTVQFYIPTPGNDTTGQLVTWSCPNSSSPAANVGACTRTVGSGSAQTEIRGVQSMVFSPVNSSGAAMSLPAQDPASLNMTLTVQVVSQLDSTQPASHVLRGPDSSPSTNPIVIQAGTDLRNFT